MNEHRERLGFPPRWLMFLAVVCCFLAVLAGVGILVFDKVSATAEKNTAQANTQTLAQDIQRVCQEQGKLLVQDRDLCAKADAAQETPTQALPGPKGDKGNDGAPGKDGAPGATGPKGEQGERGLPGVEGPKGDQGDEGLRGVFGLDGADGETGAMGPAGPVGPVGPQGEQGPKGEPGADGAPGAKGDTGAQGEPGRGIANSYCGEDGRWTVTYTDGTTSDGGVCRADPGPPAIGIP